MRGYFFCTFLFALIAEHASAATQPYQELDVLGVRIGDLQTHADETLSSRGLKKEQEYENFKRYVNSNNERVWYNTATTPFGHLISYLAYELTTTCDLTSEEVKAKIRKRYNGLGATVNGGTYVVSDPRDGATIDKDGYNRSGLFKYPYVTALFERGSIAYDNQCILLVGMHAGSLFVNARAFEKEQERRKRAADQKLSF